LIYPLFTNRVAIAFTVDALLTPVWVWLVHIAIADSSVYYIRFATVVAVCDVFYFDWL
jgi:hypothetical protein